MRRYSLNCFADNGRPNFPVNVLVALEIIKHWKDFTDEELLEQVAFNYQIAYAIGMRTLVNLIFPVEHSICFVAGYTKYALEHAGEDDLIFKQFIVLNHSTVFPLHE